MERFKGRASSKPRAYDGHKSLSRISREHGKSTVAMLLEIQRQSALQEKSTPFLKNLQCLSPLDDRAAQRKRRDRRKQCLTRVSIDALEEHDYVALSWTWKSSTTEDDTAGGYHVQDGGSGLFGPSQVRNCVFDRITRYMKATGVKLLWIDRHGIVQDTNGCEEADCKHGSCDEKRTGMQVMDRVYELSDHPVGLLGRPISSIGELNLLGKLLQGRLTISHEDGFILPPNMRSRQVRRVLAMLVGIASDDWWQRGWIFQENLRGAGRMTLLVRHSSGLESAKQTHRRSDGSALFGNVEGELCFSSEELSTEATKFCLALWEGPVLHPSVRRLDEEAGRASVDSILGALGSYGLLLRHSDPVTPAILRDIEQRGTTKHWDKLAIIANCCRYATRLKAERLWSSQSLSLSVLALCLLNGELIYNGPRKRRQNSSGMTVTEYLTKNSYRGIRGLGLQFNNSCRLFNVTLGEDGIFSHGHLWELGEIIDTAQIAIPYSWESNRLGMPRTRGRLAYIAVILLAAGHHNLASEIKEMLLWGVWDRSMEEVDGWLSEATLAQRYIFWMALEVATAFEDGRKLRLGRLALEDDREDMAMAVFILDWGAKASARGSAYAFTASKPEDTRSPLYDRNDIDRHVSFQVDVEDGQSGGPWLRTRRWLPGLCFFRGRPRRSVVFPWPEELKAIGL
ncbi:hypothetical protein OQA88_2974 [Cercophora sp. LCS_1]